MEAELAPLNILETKALSKSFGGINANSNIDFALSKGQTMALIGPNGAGKSTFVGMVCGRIPATSGKVYFEGRDISNLPAHKRISLGISYTFQITSVFSALDVRENISLAVRKNNKGNEKQVNEIVEKLAADTGLSDRINQAAGDLSYGHQRILEFCMGLAQKPTLFILDEPTQGLSESEVSEFVDLINGLSGKTTILLIEHNMDVVMRTAHRITVLNYGEVLAEGTLEEIQNNVQVQSAYLGSANA